jgi:hypothetical protein
MSALGGALREASATTPQSVTLFLGIILLLMAIELAIATLNTRRYPCHHRRGPR